MYQTAGPFDLPPLSRSTRTLLIGLFVVYALELFLRNGLSLPVDRLAWLSFGQGFAPWQPVTRYLVQGQNVFGVLMTGLVLYFLLPPLERAFSRAQLLQATAVSMAGGTALTLLLDLAGIVGGYTMGWGALVTVLLVLFGLHRPEAVVRLFFVLPVPARVIAWGTGAVTFLLLLSSFSLSSAEGFGTWAAAIGWWYGLGPGSRRRRLRRQARSIERHLRVLQGGRGDVFH